MTTRRHVHTFAAAAATLALSACATFAPAPPDPILDLAIVELNERHYESARALLHTADVERPSAAAAFYEGATLNRLGRFEQALERLDRAGARGLRDPELDFETGWTMLALGRWHAAILRLEHYEARRPGRGKASELLGRAYVGAWRPDEAERALKEAMRRDSALAPSALFHLAALERSRNDAKATQGYLRALLASAPESRLALVVPRTAAPSAIAALATDVVATRTPASAPQRSVRTLFANVREAPGIKAPILTVVKADVRLVVVGQQGGWYHVRLADGREGWIAESVTAPVAVAAASARAEANGSMRVDPAADIERALTRFVLDPNPALLVGFDAETAPLPALEVERAAPAPAWSTDASAIIAAP